MPPLLHEGADARAHDADPGAAEGVDDDPVSLACWEQEHELFLRGLLLLVVEARLRVGGLLPEWPGLALVQRLSDTVRHARMIANEVLLLQAAPHATLSPADQAAIIRATGTCVAWPVLSDMLGKWPEAARGMAPRDAGEQE
jgi:hypothetical protein